jgi:hypothetical protein
MNLPSFYNFGKNWTEITTSNIFSIIVDLFFAPENYLASRCLAMDVPAVFL